MSCHQPVKTVFTETPNPVQSQIVAHKESNHDRKYGRAPSLHKRKDTKKKIKIFNRIRQRKHQSRKSKIK